MFMKRNIVLLWLLAAATAAGAQTLSSTQLENDTLEGRGHNLSPMQYGFDTASDGVQRYWALYNTHLAARQAGVDVDYSALANKTVELTLPADAPNFIPLTRHNDFKNVLFYVLDTVADRYLFRMGEDNYTLIDVDARWVDSGDFRSVPQLAEGMHLLILNDDNPWVAERIGFGTPAMRCDVLWVVDGVSRNRVVASYQTEATKMKCYEVPVTDEPKTICNLHLRRHAGSTHKLLLFSVFFENNVNVYNVSVFTPQSKSFRHVNAAAELVKQCQGTQQPLLQNASDRTKTRLLGDAVISFRNSTNIHCRDIYVELRRQPFRHTLLRTRRAVQGLHFQEETDSVQLSLRNAAVRQLPLRGLHPGAHPQFLQRLHAVRHCSESLHVAFVDAASPAGQRHAEGHGAQQPSRALGAMPAQRAHQRPHGGTALVCTSFRHLSAHWHHQALPPAVRLPEQRDGRQLADSHPALPDAAAQGPNHDRARRHATPSHSASRRAAATDSQGVENEATKAEYQAYLRAARDGALM